MAGPQVFCRRGYPSKLNARTLPNFNRNLIFTPLNINALRNSAAASPRSLSRICVPTRSLEHFRAAWRTSAGATLLPKTSASSVSVKRICHSRRSEESASLLASRTTSAPRLRLSAALPLPSAQILVNRLGRPPPRSHRQNYRRRSGHNVPARKHSLARRPLRLSISFNVAPLVRLQSRRR